MDDAAVKAVGDELRALKERLKQEADTHISHTHTVRVTFALWGL